MSNTPEHQQQQKAKPVNVSPYVVRIATILVFIIALMRMPHLFYTIIHLLVFIICGLSLSPKNWKRRPLWTAAVVLTGIIYNPIIPLHLDRWLWIIINIPTAMLFFHALDDKPEGLLPVEPSSFIEPKTSTPTITITESQTSKKQEPPKRKSED
jgi:hypothetical protein